MSRTSVAFLVAPLWVPAAIAPLEVYMYPGEYRWVYLVTIVGTIVTYAGTLVLGVPAFVILRARNHTSFWIATALGLGIGGLTWVAFFVLLALSVGNSTAFIWREAAASVSWPSLLPCALGSIVGATVWLIARPDRGRAV